MLTINVFSKRVVNVKIHWLLKNGENRIGHRLSEYICPAESDKVRCRQPKFSTFALVRVAKRGKFRLNFQKPSKLKRFHKNYGN